MQLNVHRPIFSHAVTHDPGTDREFHTVRITEDSPSGDVVLFIRADWSDWEQLVTAVEEYRACVMCGKNVGCADG
jgi:hypothetical protein